MTAASGEDAAAKTYAEALRAQAHGLLAHVLKSPATIKACRSQLIYLPGEIINWAFPEQGSARDQAVKSWLAAAEQLAKDATLSIDNRLWASAVELAFFRLDKKDDDPVPAALAEKLKDAVAIADKRATTPFERRSVISGAAYLLRQIRAFSDARALLLKELQKTDTPWYYQSSLANLEKAAGNDTEALRWAAKARESAKGRASKIQWIVEDLVLTAKTKTTDPQEQSERLQAVLKAYYDLALQLPDGFSGRNATRAARVANEIKPWAKQANVQALLRSYEKQCPTHVKSPDCAAHFKSLL